MAILAKVLKNTELDAVLKIKSDKDGGSITITKEMLCYRPADQRCVIDDKSIRFQDYVDKSSMSIVCMEWAGYTQDGSGRLYRGGKDLEHTIATFCVGDTCQGDFQGQEMTPDIEYNRENLEFEFVGEITLWIRLRKRDFKNYAGEYATYGAFEDDSKRGPVKWYEDLLNDFNK